MKLPKAKLKKPLFSGSEWTLDNIHKGWDIIQLLAKQYKWEGYPVQFEIITAEQLISKEAFVGMPIMYNHAYFGEAFLQLYNTYEKGRGLAYEMIINTNPSICYIAENNSQMMQLLVTAHAAIGHNYFFKNNYLFKEWTDPDQIVDYLIYSKDFLNNCEKEYGLEEVQFFISIAKYLEDLGLNKYKKKSKTNKDKLQNKEEVTKHIEETYNPIIHGNFKDYRKNILTSLNMAFESKSDYQVKSDNILTSLASYSRILEDWQREVLIIISKINQYFYPQMQDKMLNEGFASFVHYTLMEDLHKYGYIDDSYILEFFDSHTHVCHAEDFIPQNGVGPMNPYYLGYNLFKDIKRMAENPTEEDIKFNPFICNRNWVEVVNEVVANYRDESAITSFLSPYLIRKLKLLNIYTTKELPHYLVANIHQECDYENIRNKLAKQLSVEAHIPDVEISFYVDRNTNFIREEVPCIKVTFKTHLEQPIKKDVIEQLILALKILTGHERMVIIVNNEIIFDHNRFVDKKTTSFWLG